MLQEETILVRTKWPIQASLSQDLQKIIEDANKCHQQITYLRNRQIPNFALRRSDKSRKHPLNAWLALERFLRYRRWVPRVPESRVLSQKVWNNGGKLETRRAASFGMGRAL